MAKIIKFLERYGLLIVLITCLFMATVIRFYYQKKAIVIWDEGHHSEWVYWNIEAIRQGNWDQLINLTKSALTYPPLYTLIMVIPMLFWEPSMELIRLTNLMFFIASAILTYVLAKQISKNHKSLTGLIAAMFFIFSPMMIVFGTIALREMMGAGFTLATSILYIKGIKSKPFYLIFASIALIATTMIKYNFGTLIVGAIVANEGIEFLLKSSKIKILSRTLIILIPFALFMIWWLFIFQNSFGHFVWVLGNKIGFFFTGESTFINYLLFYPRGIVYLYSGSIALGLIILSTFLVSIWRFRNPVIRFMWIAVVANIILGTIHIENMEERYILTIVPFVFCLSAYVIIDLLNAFYQIFRRGSMVVIYYFVLVVACAIILKDFIKLPSYIFAAGSYTNKTPLFNQENFKALQFDYDTDHWFFPIPPDDAIKPKDVFEMIAKTVDVSKPVAFIGEANEFSQTYRSILFKDYLRHNKPPDLPYSQYAVITDFYPTSKFYTFDYKVQHEWKMQNRYEIENDPNWIKLKTEEYKTLGINVAIYAKY
jgi:hypothetical protein